MSKTLGATAAIILLLFGFASSTYAQEPVVLPSTYRHLVHSEINGVDYQLTVVLP